MTNTMIAEAVYGTYEQFTATPQPGIGLPFGAVYSLRNNPVEAKFRRLAQRWRRETAAFSSLTKIVSHPAYLEIIAMGEKALPLILEDLEKRVSHWFVALAAISGEDVISADDAGDLRRMTAAWLSWGRDRGVI